MKNLRIIGAPGNGGASYQDDGSHNGQRLKPCPFCGGDVLGVENTHSASYWVVCECGAQKDGDDFVSEAEEATTEAELIAAHEKAFQSAVDAWNERAD